MNLEERVARTETDLLREQVDRLTAQVKDLKPRRDLLSVLKDLAPLITPIIVALFTLYATRNITAAIERQKLQLSHVSAMKDLMVKLATPGIERGEAEATAVSLAAFGTAALPPLLYELEASGEVRPLAAAAGIRAVALEHGEDTCAFLTRILENRSGLFSWRAHRRVIDLLGRIGCSSSVPALESLRATLAASEGLDQYRRMVSEDDPPSQRHLKTIVEALDDALERIGQ